ncbi:MAG TPA: hypothetical protein DCG19_09170 [Cryomorphaceae bacterium]|nr:hypothetical protein [Cryomorphaceae bacterium]
MRTILPIFSLSLLILMSGCESPTKDIDLHIDPAFYKYVAELDLQDLSSNGSDDIADKIKVSISGPDAASIYNINGKKEISPSFNSLQLITTRANEPKAGKPLQFTVHIESRSGYAYPAQSIDVSIEEGEYFTAQEVFLLDYNRIPSGSVDRIATTAKISSGTLNKPLVISTDPATGNPSQVTVTIPDNIQFMDKTGTAISSGQLSVELINFSDTNEVAQLAMPNNTGSIQSMELDGQVEDVLMQEAPIFEINMKVGAISVTNFSGNGIQLSIPLPDHMYNEDAERPYQAGDVITLISYTEGDAFWKEDGDYTIKDVNGQLVVEANLTHLSKASLKKKTAKYLKLLKKLPNGSAPAKVRRLTLKLTKLDPRRAKRYYKTAVLKYPAQFTERRIQALSRNVERIVALQGRKLSRTLKITKKSFDEYDIEKLETGGINAGYKLYCPSYKTYVLPPSGVHLYFRKTAEGGEFEHLLTFEGNEESGNLYKVPFMEDGVSYDLKAYYSTYEIDTMNVLATEGKIYELNLPKALCDEAF